MEQTRTTASPARPAPDSALLTAPTAKGQAAIERILAAAVELLAHEGHAGLSMRKVAQRLNLRLSAVQHHFPSWESLLQAMMRRVQDHYVRVIDSYLAQEKTSRIRQFENVLGYLLRDIKSPVTQSLFAQLWALAQTNAFAREVMQGMYDYERSVFAFFVAELNPGLGKKEVALRAALMVTQIEGLMLLIPQGTRFPSPLAGMEQYCIDRIIALALLPAEDAGMR